MNNETQEAIQIWTDGACLGNPGYGGWAVLTSIDGDEQIRSGCDSDITTSNVMELTAAIRALEGLPVGWSAVLYSDSNYVIQGITTWINKWKVKGWRTFDRKPVANQELWQRLDALNSERSITWKKVKGHSGHRQNEVVDVIAKAAAEKASELISTASFTLP